MKEGMETMLRKLRLSGAAQTLEDFHYVQCRIMLSIDFR